MSGSLTAGSGKVLYQSLGKTFRKTLSIVQAQSLLFHIYIPHQAARLAS